MVKNSPEHSSPSSLAPPLPTLDLPESELFSPNKEESQIAEPLCRSGTTLGNAPDAPNAPVHVSQQERTLENQSKSIAANFTCKDTIATWISDFPMKIVEL